MMIIFAFDSMYQLRQKETNLPHGMLMMVDAYEKVAIYSLYILEIRLTPPKMH